MMIHKVALFKKLIVFFIFWISSVNVLGQEFRLEGKFVQGGMVVGFAAHGVGVQLDGKEIGVSTDGVFILGFGRDAPEKSYLTVTQPNGKSKTRTLRIKNRNYKVERIDGLSSRKVSPDQEDLKRIHTERRLVRTAREKTAKTAFFLSGFDWPVNGRISGVFGSQRILNGKPRRPHLGLDIAALEGTHVKAPADGKVTLTHPGMFFNGKTIILDHGLSLSSIYVHLSEVSIATGEAVKKGQVIGKIGKTGRATGPHVHWGVRWEGVDLDPLLLVSHN